MLFLPRTNLKNLSPPGPENHRPRLKSEEPKNKISLTKLPFVLSRAKRPHRDEKFLISPSVKETRKPSRRPLKISLLFELCVIMPNYNSSREMCQLARLAMLLRLARILKRIARRLCSAVGSSRSLFQRSAPIKEVSISIHMGRLEERSIGGLALLVFQRARANRHV